MIKFIGYYSLLRTIFYLITNLSGIVALGYMFWLFTLNNIALFIAIITIFIIVVIATAYLFARASIALIRGPQYYNLWAYRIITITTFIILFSSISGLTLQATRFSGLSASQPAYAILYSIPKVLSIVIDAVVLVHLLRNRNLFLPQPQSVPQQIPPIQ